MGMPDLQMAEFLVDNLICCARWDREPRFTVIYFTALDRVSRLLFGCIVLGTVFIVERYGIGGLIRFGDDLLSHVLRRSTIGATALNGWVRDGTRCFARAVITKPSKSSGSLFARGKVGLFVMPTLVLAGVGDNIFPSHVQ